MAPSALTQPAMDSLTLKMKNPDPDLRLMSLLDLQKDLSSSAGRMPDENQEVALVSELLRMIDDSNGEVKNVAVNTLSILVARIKRVNQVTVVINALLKNSASGDDGQRDIADMALKKVMDVIPVGSPIVPEVIEKVSTSVLKQIQVPDVHVQHAVELIDILALIFIRFPGQVTSRAQLQTNSLNVLLSLLSSPRPHIRKRSIAAVSALAPLLSENNFALLSKSLMKVLGESSGNDSMDVDDAANTSTSYAASELVKRTSYASLVGALSRTCTGKMAKGLETLMPCLLKLTEEMDNEDALEASMTTLETIVLRCPTEVTPFLTQIATRCTVLLKYDPNYAADEDDEEMDEEEEDEDDDEYDDEFEQQDDDEEDSSWKARRSAAKLIYALISTRPESLPTWFASFAPLLTARLNEREESVRLEVFADWEVLLRQTTLSAGSSWISAGEAPSGLKRKRTESNEGSVMGNDIIVPTSPLTAELPALIKAVIKQTLVKSPATKEKSFALLKAIVDIRGGGLEPHSDAVAASVKKAFDQIESGSAGGAATASLLATVLAFLGTYFEHQPARVYADTLSTFVPYIVKCMSDKYARISTQAFSTAAQLARGLRPQPTSGSVTPIKESYKPSIVEIYKATAGTVAGNQADAEVRNKALVTLGDLLVHEGDMLQAQQEECFKILSERLDSDASRLTALQVTSKVAESTLCNGNAFDNWLQSTLSNMPTLLRRSHSATRLSVLHCLTTILTRTGQQLSASTATTLLNELKPCISREKQDILVLPPAIQVITQIFGLQTKCRPVIDKEILPLLLELISSEDKNSDAMKVSTPDPTDAESGAGPISQGPALEALLQFFAAYTQGTDKDAGVKLVATLFSQAPTNCKMPAAGSFVLQAYPSIAKAVGVIMSQNVQVFAYFAPEFRQPFEKKAPYEGQIYLTLLTVGETGRTINQSAQSEHWDKLFTLVSKLLEHPVEQIKSAAAFCLGNIAVGNTKAYLPQIVNGVTKPKTSANGLLYLHALKETIEHCSSDQIEDMTASLWSALLGKETEEQDEGARNVRAACIGKLATAKPSTYLPELHSRISSPSASTRATIAAAIRYTLVDNSASYDELLSPLILDFLMLMDDSDYNVRRLAVTSLNAAAQNKPELVQPHLIKLLPALYKETVKRPELVFKYQMGPFAVERDDGLSNRKAAFEAMMTLLKTCSHQLDRNQLLDYVIKGLEDDDEIKVLCCVLLQRLLEVAPAAVMARLDSIAAPMKPIMEPLTPTQHTTAQDTQRKDELRKAAVRAILPIYKVSRPIGPNKFNDLVSPNMASWKEIAV